jgi:hypothetical protein
MIVRVNVEVVILIRPGVIVKLVGVEVSSVLVWKVTSSGWVAALFVQALA